jgi:hypothetical protein
VCRSATRSLATPLFSRSAHLPASVDPRNKRSLGMKLKTKSGVWVWESYKLHCDPHTYMFHSSVIHHCEMNWLRKHE